jgi:tetratricopeptide (TPR) repeat protein
MLAKVFRNKNTISIIFGIVLLASLGLSCLGIPEFLAWLHYGKGTLLASQKSYDQALVQYDLALNAESVKLLAYTGKATLYFNLDEYDKAIAECDKAIAANDRDYLAYEIKANSLLNLDQAEAALEICNKSIACNSGYAEAYTTRALIYLDLLQFLPCLEDCQKALILDPEYVRAYFIRGRVELMAAGVDSREFDKSIKDFTRAIQLAPNDPLNYYYRAQAYQGKNEIENAGADFSKVISLGTDSDLVKKSKEQLDLLQDQPH